ncbi:MAG: hypothetical protein A3I39_01865 [Candidatus Yanofskybacteria bacterium RIFCSPLOWO2_02_FULL_47_9b]|uniref:Protein kinase domain-containing protein n=1 Tax=Candidatus Yanofskybacteria bacterium RIFCSPLOWO2_02_FULL_47_9b TaxID=1802708 RepID=A0A1F8HAW7_9BACT|nr:MAG: hypothetical protein A3I39_01865 [Candidatus Yanofskybacteria bacterium RIFCSPLOWO2_02_FULL_47_9b]
MGNPDFKTEFDKLFQHFSEEIAEIRKGRLLGEGRAAKVFDLTDSWGGHPVCVKLYHPHLSELSPIEYKKVQAVTPADEFSMQDRLFTEKFPVSEPLYTDTEDGQPYIVMEKIHGYTLTEINENGGLIVSPTWAELEKLITELNNQRRIVHRDLHPGNIMLQTEQRISSTGRKLSGKLYIIDFGSSKSIFSDNPTLEDFSLTIGNSVIKYTTDHFHVRILKPRTGGDNLFLR